VAIVVKFFTAKRTQVPVGLAKFDLNRCNESRLWGEQPVIPADCRIEAIKNGVKRNKSITSKAMQYRQRIYVSGVNYNVNSNYNSTADFLRFGKFPP